MAPEIRNSQQQVDYEFFKTTWLAIQHSLGHLTSQIEKLELNQNQESIPHGTQHIVDSSSSRTTSTIVNSLLEGIKLEIPKFSGVDILGCGISKSCSFSNSMKYKKSKKLPIVHLL